MRLSKDLVDKMTRSFRAELNKAAKDSLIHENFYYKNEKTVIHFAVEVKPNPNSAIDRTWVDVD